MKIIDTHCHLDFKVFDEDRTQVVTQARANGLAAFIIPAVKKQTWQALITMCETLPDAYYALGLHPVFISEHQYDDINALKDILETSRPIAIGEIGLDFYDKSLDIEKQLTLFEQQLQLACDIDLPVILHVRKAHEEVLACLKKYPVKGGVVHAFNASLQQAERYMVYNFKFGFGGMLTYERSSKLRKLARELPIDSMVLETDSPDMTVQAHRGERNSPEYLPDCLASLAEIRDLPISEIADQTTQNALKVFKDLRI